jgi:phosphate-selective porin OprO/OprP
MTDHQNQCRKIKMKANSNTRWRFLTHAPAVLFMLAMITAHAQDGAVSFLTTNPPPAETNLEAALPAGEAEAEPPKRDLVSWNHYEGRWFSLRVNGAALEDFSTYSQNAASVNQVGTMNPAAEVRTVRLMTSGQVKFANPWSYFVSGEYLGFDQGTDTSSSQYWRLTDLSLTIPVSSFAQLTIGKIKAPISLERLMGGTVIPFMERPAILDALLPSRDTGMKLSGTVLDQRMTWSAGWFNTWFGGSESSFGNSANTVAGRITGLPIAEPAGGTLLHVAVSGRYAEAQGDQLRYKSHPEDNNAPTFLDTGNFTADHAVDLGLETGWQQGPVLTSAEYLADWVSSSQNGDPFINGFYVSSAWMLTGEQRNYNRTGGYFGRVSPAHPLFHGGWGAWEVAGRYSWVDLNSGGISGGKFDRWSAALSWYATDHMRFEFDYGYGQLDKFGTEGTTQFFQARAQIEF